MTTPTTSPENDSHSDSHSHDRNFDDIADHFEHKIYGGLKGQIRLAVLTRDIMEMATTLSAKLGRPLKILDVGAGLGQISLLLAKSHHCTINDISANMLAKAKTAAAAQGIDDSQLHFICCPYQALPEHIKGEHFDLILCHALLEWLHKPAIIMDFFDEFLCTPSDHQGTTGGVLSLCFYNPASLIYRNLVMGNFYQLSQPKAADNKSLTPNSPTDPKDVAAWLDERHYHTIKTSGIRVFSDYAPLKRGGLNNPQDVIDMELRYADQAPFCHMGRYLHILAERF